MKTEAIKAAMSLAVEQGIPTLYFTDVSPVKVVQTMLVAFTGMDLEHIDGTERVSNMEYHLLDEKMKAFTKVPLYIHECMGILSFEDLVRTVDDCIRVHEIKVVIVECPGSISQKNKPANETNARLNDLAHERGIQVIM